LGVAGEQHKLRRSCDLLVAATQVAMIQQVLCPRFRDLEPVIAEPFWESAGGSVVLGSF